MSDVALARDAYLSKRAQAGDARALNSLARHYEGFIRSRALYYARRRPGVELDDVFQASSEGFVKAVKKYEPARGLQLATFARHWCDCEIRLVLNKRLVNSNDKTIRIRTTPLDDATKLPPVSPTQLGSVNGQDARRVLGQALTALPERERMIIENCVLREPKLDLRATGVLIGISGERVRQIRDSGLGRMRDFLEARGLKLDDML